MPTNYQNAKIYSIRSRSRPDLVYIGSTTQGLAKRFGGHNYLFRNNRLKCTSKKVIEIGDAFVELVETYACPNRNELERREGEIIRSMDCVNKQIPGRTKQEWLIDNKERNDEWHKQYRDDNKVKIKQWRENNKERTKQQRKQHYLDNTEQIKQSNKQYHNEHKEQISQRMKRWSENNKEHLKQANKQYREKKKDNRICICGVNYNYGNSSIRKKHYISKHHTNFVSSFTL